MDESPTSATHQKVGLLPWPRMAQDGVTPLGLDLALLHDDVRRLVMAKHRNHWHEPDDLVSEVIAAIARKNRQACAYNPKRAGLAKYVLTVARSVLANLKEADEHHDVGADAARVDPDQYVGEHDPRPMPLWQIALLSRAEERAEFEEARRLARERTRVAPIPGQLTLFGAPAPAVPQPRRTSRAA